MSYPARAEGLGKYDIKRNIRKFIYNWLILAPICDNCLDFKLFEFGDYWFRLIIRDDCKFIYIWLILAHDK